MDRIIGMARYLDPKSDIVFKKVFGEHPTLLKSFLNAVLPLPENGQIVELTYLPTECIPAIPLLKRTIADVQCTDQQGRIFIVEMQIDWVESFRQRLLFQAGQAYIKQLEKGETYHLLKPVYGLGLIAAQFDEDPKHWYHHYQLVNLQKSKPEVIEQLQLVFIELPKFPISSPTEKKLRLLWLRFMREINQKTLEVSPDLLAIPEIEEAIHLTEEAAYSPDELRAYDKYWDGVSTERTLMEGKMAEGIAQGMARGREEGMAEGVVRGREEGIAQGIAQEREKMKQQLLASGLSIEKIHQLMGEP